MLVYRIENSEGGGPYTDSTITPARLDWSYEYPDCQPTPRWSQADFFKFGYDYTKFAFSSLDQFQKWWDTTDERISGQWKGMQEAGFYLRVYEVPEDYVVSDDHQAAFHKDWARRATERSLQEFAEPSMITEEILTNAKEN